MTEQTFDKLEGEVSKGLSGENEAIPIGMEKLGRYANFRKRIFTLIFSSTGAGKSALIDDMMLNACEHVIKQKKTGKEVANIHFKIFSMERSKHLRVAKWVVRKIFIEHGVTIPLPKLLGWWDLKMTKDEHDLFLLYRDYISTLLEDYIDIHEGAKTPNEIYHIMKEWFKQNGVEENITEYKKLYLPNDETKIVVPIIDHGSLLRTTKDLYSKKMAIDMTSGYMQTFRDFYGASPVWVAQVNRALSGISRTKDAEYELGLDDVKESGDIGDACDIALSLFDPAKFNQASKTGYIPKDFIDPTTGAKYFRSVQIVKSSYGEDDVRIPLAFNGFCGQFKEMKRRKDLDEYQYKELIDKVLTKKYFL